MSTSSDLLIRVSFRLSYTRLAWAGLYHTFDEGGLGCDGPGDLVDDAPAQEESTRGCPLGRDTCPDHPGLDHIRNYV
jgi:hypothetical protein